MSSALLASRTTCAPISRPCAQRSVARAAPVGRARTLVVRAELQDPLRNVQGAVQSFVKRYDILSTGVGAVVVTGYCVYAHGQDPFTALSITFTSTVVALVANELLFSSEKQ